jgi:hypothetical protein
LQTEALPKKQETAVATGALATGFRASGAAHSIHVLADVEAFFSRRQDVAFAGDPHV